MKKQVLLSIIFFIGLIMANYSTEWEWNSVKTFLSGGMLGAWILLLVQKLCKKS